MPDFRITVTETFGAPEGTTLLEGARGLLLPSGEIIKPWIVLELNEDRDLTGEEMDRLGLDVGLDFARIVEPIEAIPTAGAVDPGVADEVSAMAASPLADHDARERASDGRVRARPA